MTHSVNIRDAYGNHKRTVFRGTEDDARAYLVSNFPRLHIEPGTDYGDEGPTPDAILVSENGDTEHFNGSEWVNPKAVKDNEVSEPVADDEDEV